MRLIQWGSVGPRQRILELKAKHCSKMSQKGDVKESKKGLFFKNYIG